jgi:hypothetical protein
MQQNGTLWTAQQQITETHQPSTIGPEPLRMTESDQIKPDQTKSN